MKGRLVGLTVMALTLGAHSQTKKVPCYSGDTYPSCTPAQQSARAQALAKAKTAAVIIEATQTIACGDGSDGCFRTDGSAVAIIEREINDSGLWDNLTKVEAKRADILLKFNARNRMSLGLAIYDADSNNLLWQDTRSPSIALDNDAAKEIGHFLAARKALSSSRTTLPVPQFVDGTRPSVKAPEPSTPH